jgi:hypothetical protein
MEYILIKFQEHFKRHFSELNVSLVSSEIKKKVRYITDGRESTGDNAIQPDTEIEYSTSEQLGVSDKSPSTPGTLGSNGT